MDIRLKSTSRLILAAAVTIASVTAVLRPAVAQDYPNDVVRFVVAQAAGGVGDVIARSLAQELSTSLGEQVIVENVPGANGLIGVGSVVKSKPDGYTILLGSSANLAINAALYKKLPYDPEADLVPIALIGKFYYTVLVPAASEAKSLNEFVTMAKADPGKMNFGAGGSPTRFGTEMFNQVAQISVTHVPYKSNSQALTDLLGGQLDVVFESATTAAPHVKSGQLRALAVTSPERLPQFPEVPTVAESGFPGYELSGWVSVVAPAGTPADVQAKLTSEVQKLLAKPEVVDRFRTLGIEVKYGSPEELKALLKSDIASYKRAVVEAGIPQE